MSVTILLNLNKSWREIIILQVVISFWFACMFFSFSFIKSNLMKTTWTVKFGARRFNINNSNHAINLSNWHCFSYNSIWNQWNEMSSFHLSILRNYWLKCMASCQFNKPTCIDSFLILVILCFLLSSLWPLTSDILRWRSCSQESHVPISVSVQ